MAWSAIKRYPIGGSKSEVFIMFLGLLLFVYKSVHDVKVVFDFVV